MQNHQRTRVFNSGAAYGHQGKSVNVSKIVVINQENWEVLSYY